jgi:cadmium resistance protein CadD (predicted permease)
VPDTLLVVLVATVAFVTTSFDSLILRSALERWGPRVLPFVLIAIGIYILLDTSTDALVARL